MKTLDSYITEKLFIGKGKSETHYYEDLWDLIYKLEWHEYDLEDDDEFFEDLQSLPRINNLPGSSKKYNGWVVTRIEANGNRALNDYGPDHKDALKIMTLQLLDLQNPHKRINIDIESDDEYTEYLEERAREIIHIAVQELLKNQEND
jgi:hypothetical protein